MRGVEWLDSRSGQPACLCPSLAGIEKLVDALKKGTVEALEKGMGLDEWHGEEGAFLKSQRPIPVVQRGVQSPVCH